MSCQLRAEKKNVVVVLRKREVELNEKKQKTWPERAWY